MLQNEHQDTSAESSVQPRTFTSTLAVIGTVTVSKQFSRLVFPPQIQDAAWTEGGPLFLWFRWLTLGQDYYRQDLVTLYTSHSAAHWSRSPCDHRFPFFVSYLSPSA